MVTVTKNVYTIKVRPSSSERKIENFGNDRYLVKVKSSNNEEINTEVIEMFSVYFGIPKQRIEIVSGYEGNDKILKMT